MNLIQNTISQFPLVSVILVGILVIGSSELYSGIVILNALAFVLVVSDVTDMLAWFVVFELTVATAVSTLVIESRSYRRTYALFTMLGLTLLSAAIVYFAIGTTQSFSVVGTGTVSSALTGTALAILFLVKTPSFPFSLWLPEAHVEASWPGSVVLAGYALKFATVGVLLFANRLLPTLDIVILLAIFSVLFATLAMSSTSDCKKLIANFSIVHMSATLVLLLHATTPVSRFMGDYSWHHHSIVTGLLFVVIGLTYALSGSRVLRYFAASHMSSLPIFTTIVLLLFTLTLDLPWTSNVFVELSFVASAVALGGTVLSVVVLCLISFFFVLLVGYIVATSQLPVRGGNSPTTGSGIDISSRNLTLWLAAIASILAIGFGQLLFHHLELHSSRTWNLILFTPTLGSLT